MEHHLKRSAMSLQIQKSIAAKVGVDQPPDEDESSPPYIRFDDKISSNVLGEGATDRDFFKVFGAYEGSEGYILSGCQRIRLIHRHLMSHVNLETAVMKQLFVKWYPAHMVSFIAELQACWAKWSYVKDLSCVQPLSLMNDYFGSRVAFIFAWNGLYCKMLIALVPIAILFESVNAYVVATGSSQFWNRGSVLGFSLVVAIWAKVTANLWKQEQEYLVTLWDLKDIGQDKSTRPDFEGEWRDSEIDMSQQELYYPKWKANIRSFCSWLVTSIFCIFVLMVVILWIDANDGIMNPFASIVQAILIQIFTQIYNWMAEALTIAENHKYQESYYDSYLKKMFIFQFVNQYSAFFYVAVKQQFTEFGCTDFGHGPDCVAMLKKQIPTTLATLAIMRIVQVVVATLKVKIALWLEAYHMKKDGMDPPVYTYAEEQGKFSDFRIREQIEVMTQLALTLGFILIFSAIAPRVVILCFFVFIVQLRAAAVLITSACNRTVPRRTVGIGPWQDVASVLMGIGVLFSGYLLVQFGPLFKDTIVLTKVTGFLMYLALVRLIWAGVDAACPASSDCADLLDARRRHVARKVAETSEDNAYGRLGKPRATTGDNATRSSGASPPRGIWGRWQGKAPAEEDAEPPEEVGTSTVQLLRRQAEFAAEVEAGAWQDIPKPLEKAD